MRPKDFSKVPFDPGQVVQAQQQCALMHMLPPELRNRIYNLVLGDTIQPQIRGTFGPDIKPQAPSLLLTCKQIHFEAIKLHWANSTFIFNPASSPVAWLRKIGRRRRELLTAVRIQNPAIGDSWYVCDLRTQVSEAGAQLAMCENSAKGVAPGVIKMDILLPTPEGTTHIWAQLQSKSKPSNDTKPPSSGVWEIQESNPAVFVLSKVG